MVTTGADNKYSIPVTLFLWGLPENKEEVVKRCRLGQLYLGGDVEPQAREATAMRFMEKRRKCVDLGLSPTSELLNPGLPSNTE